MGYIGYLIIILIVYPLSYLPFWVLHRISDGLYLLIYYIIPYRKGLVYKQLRASFPEKSDQEIKRIAKEFYKHLCDLVVESIKAFSISDKAISQRHRCINRELTDQLFAQGRSVVAVTGHYNNWEWYAFSGPMFFNHELGGIYKPLTNPAMEKLILDSRQRTGMNMIPIKKAQEFYKRLTQVPAMICLAADQCPAKANKSFWTYFLNQETPVYFGPEKLAKEYNCAVVYVKTTKIKRSVYEFELILVSDDPQNTAYGEITDKHLAILEDQIRTKPEHWLWSHRRWKRQRPEGIAMRQRVEE